MGAGQPLVSVIVPVYNGERFLGEALQSLASQTYGRLQIIVVNDGSTDGSEAVVLGSGIELEYVAQRNGGIASAYNTGISRARGEFVSFLEHDDVWLPHKLAREVEYFCERPQVGMVYSRYYISAADGRYREEDVSQLELAGDAFAQLIGLTLSGPTILPFSSATVRRSLLEEIGPLDASLAISIDYDTWLKIAYRAAIGFVAEPGLCYRQHAGNTSRNGLRAVEDDLRILEAWARLPDAVQRIGHQALQRRIAKCHIDLAWMHQQAGDTAAARRALARAARKEPTSLAAWRRFAMALFPNTAARQLEWYGARLRGAITRRRTDTAADPTE